ncbi:hypothetical protein V6L77_01360 [Pannonibacter sp. Pt2-lr]
MADRSSSMQPSKLIPADKSDTLRLAVLVRRLPPALLTTTRQTKSSRQQDPFMHYLILRVLQYAGRVSLETFDGAGF